MPAKRGLEAFSRVIDRSGIGDLSYAKSAGVCWFGSLHRRFMAGVCGAVPHAFIPLS